MPTYVYKCKDCGHQFETVQRMSEDPLKVCPECKGEINRLLFAPGIVFKGSGFHVNDYPSSKSGGSASTSATSTSEAAPAKAEEKKTEVASAKKEEKKTEPAAAKS